MAKPASKRARNKPSRRRLPPAEQARIGEIFARFEAEEGDPATELDYQSPFTLVVAVALSAQATDVSVNKATERLFKVADTPQKMLALGEAGLKPFIASIGLFNTKAKNVIALSSGTWSRTMAARSRWSARSCKPCPASAARPPPWC